MTIKRKTSPTFTFVFLTEYFRIKYVQSTSRKITLLQYFLNDSHKSSLGSEKCASGKRLYVT